MKSRFLVLKKEFSTAIYFLKLTYGISKSYIPTLVLLSMIKALWPFINIIMPKFIIDELLGQKRINTLIIIVTIIIVGNFIFNGIERWINYKISIKNIEVLNGFKLLIGKKIMTMDFENIEDPEVLELKDRAMYPIDTQNVIEQIIVEFANVFTSIISLIGLLALICSLDLYIVILIILIVILNSFINKKVQKVRFEFPKVLIPLNRISEYYYNVITDFSCGKDVRLYDMSPLILGRLKENNETSIKDIGKLFKSLWNYNGINRINLQIQMALIYGYMTYKVLKESIGIGSFTMYVVSANKFNSTLTEAITSFMTLRQMCKYLDEYMKLEQIKSKNSEGNKPVGELKEFNIEFRNVYFRYPRSKEYTLKNISITIKQGEKLSIVGLNGAGKTTFIKLLTRLYEPTKGEILLNGVNIREYKYEEYMRALAVVFQDFKLMAFTVKENIALKGYEKCKDEEIKASLKKSGLEKDILKLEKGINTHIYKTFEEDGIEFSGGQGQKLAISRAIYKDSPIIILDEPTAALDPIAEFEIYSKFNELVGEKTAIYISHRLSSCRFCDRVAVFHEGEIVELGCHDELMENHKHYEILYNAQAQYYV